MRLNNESAVAHSFAMSSMMYILLVLICIALSWWSLQQFRFDLFLKNAKSGQGKLLQILISIVMGYEVARFFIDYFNWSALLKGMFQ
jgi:uncharacterized integral membrane protein (TIGR02327 family)